MAALNAIGSSELTAEVAIIASSVPSQPDAPTKTTASLSSVSIEWTTPDNGGSPITKYILKMNGGTGSNEFNVIDANVDPSATSYTKSGLKTGDDYRFILSALNAVGESPPSAESAEMRIALKPDAPGDPTYLSSSTTTMQFSWTSPLDVGRSDGGTSILGYIIQWDEGDPDAS